MQLFKNFFFFLIGIVLTLVILEVFLQLGEVNSLPEGEQDDVLGVKLKSNHNYLYFNEGFTIGQINNDGYYGSLYNEKIDDQTYRIALLGDSYVEGVQVFERNHFRTKLEFLLNKEKKENVEVLNFGRSGFNLNDIYCYYINFVSRYNSKIKFVFISPGDLVDKKNDNSKPFAYLNNGELDIDYSFNKTNKYLAKKSTKHIRGKSIVLGYLGRTYELIKTDNYKHVLFGKFSNFLKKRRSNSHVSKSNEQLSETTKKIIIELSNEGCIFVIHNETTKNDFDYLLDDFKDFVNKQDIKTIDLSVLFKKLKGKEVNYNYWPITKMKGHFNEIGHEEIAKFLKEYLIK